MFLLNWLQKTFKLKFDRCQIIDLINDQINRSWLNSRVLNSVWILIWNKVKLFTVVKKDSINVVLRLKNLFHQFGSTDCRCFWSSSLSIGARNAGRFFVFSDCLIRITMDRRHCLQAVLEYKVCNQNHRGIEHLKMYAIKQIKICAEYRGMVPKPSAGLWGTFELWSIRFLGNPPSPWVHSTVLLHRS